MFGNRDYFTGLGVFLDTYSNHNGEHDVCEKSDCGLLWGDHNEARNDWGLGGGGSGEHKVCEGELLGGGVMI